MKILHLAQNYHPSQGGVQWMMQRHSENLVRLYGDEVSVFTTNALLGPQAAENELIATGVERLNGVEVRRFGFSTTWMKLARPYLRASARLRLPVPGRGLIDLLNIGPISPGMYWAVRRSQADILAAAPGNYLHTYYPLLGRRPGKRKPYVIFGTLHLHSQPVANLTLRAIRQADAYIALTDFEREYLAQRGIPAERMHVISPGVDLENYQGGNGERIRAQYGIGDAPVVLFLGRQAAYKGVDKLLKAMRTVWQTQPEAFVLVAGAETPFSETLRRMIAEFSPGEKAHTILVGSIPEPEKADYYAASDLFVTISTEESFGMVYLEAWACQKPVIGARIGAVASLIREGMDGLLVEAESIPELAEAICSLISDADLRREMGTKGYERVKQEYTWEIATRKLRKLYEELV